MRQQTLALKEPSWKKELDNYFSDDGFKVSFEHQENTNVSAINFSPSGKLLAFIVESTIKIYKISEQKVIHEIKEKNISPKVLCFITEKILAIGTESGQLRILDIETKWEFDVNGVSNSPCIQILFSKIHSSIFLAHTDSLLGKYHFHPEDHKVELVGDFRLFGSNIKSFDVSEDEKILLMISDKQFEIHDLDENRIINSANIVRKNSNLPVVILNKKKQFAFNINKFTIAIHNLETGEHLRDIEDPRRMELIGMTFIQKENYMLTMSEDGYMRLYNITKWHPMNYLNASAQIFRSKKFLIAPNLKYFGMVTYKNAIKCWPLLNTDHTEILKNLGHFSSNRSIKTFKITKKNKMIAGYTDGSIVIYCLRKQEVIKEIKEPDSDCINGLDISPDEKIVITGGKDKRYRIYELNDEQNALTLKHKSGLFVDSILEISIFAEGAQFVVCVKGGIMQITNTNTHEPIEIAHGDWWAHDSVYHNIRAVKKDILVIGNDSGTLDIFNLTTYKEEAPILSIHLTSIKALCVSKTNQFVITGGRDPYLTYVTLSSGLTKSIKLPKDIGEIRSLEMSNNDKYVLITTSESVSIYDLEGNHRTHTEYIKGINHAVFTSDNKSIYISLAKDEVLIEKLPFLDASARNIHVLDYSFEVPFRAMSSIPYMKLRRLFNGEDILTPSLIKSFEFVKVIPFEINLWNLYSFILDSEELPKITNMIIDTEIPLINDAEGNNIFTYLLDKYDIVTLNTIFKRAPEALSKSSEDVYTTLSRRLPDIIKTRVPSIPEFLDSCICSAEPVRGDPPIRLFGNSSPWRTYLFTNSTRISIDEQNLLSTASGHDPINFRVSKLVYHNNYSTSHYLRILDAIYQTTSLDIYKSTMVQRIIDVAWTQAYPTLTITFVFNLAFLVIFSVSLGYQTIPYGLSLVVLIMNALLSCYEIVQLLSRPKDYLTSGWNLIDLAKNALIFVTFALNVKKTTTALESIEDNTKIVCSSLAVLFVYLKMISYFSIIKQTRTLIRVINEVLIDMFSFILILVFIVFAWALIFFQIEANTGVITKTLPTHILNVYLIIFSSFQSNYEGFERPFFIIVSFFVSIILLNLLISIISDTYQRVQTNAVPSDNLEKLGILIEITSVRVFLTKLKRGFKQKKYDSKYYEENYKHLMWVTENEDESGNIVNSKEGTLGELHKLVKGEIAKIREEDDKYSDLIDSKLEHMKEMERNILSLNNKQEIMQRNMRLLSRQILTKKKVVNELPSNDNFDEGPKVHTINLPK